MISKKKLDFHILMFVSQNDYTLVYSAKIMPIRSVRVGRQFDQIKITDQYEPVRIGIGRQKKVPTSAQINSGMYNFR